MSATPTVKYEMRHEGAGTTQVIPTSHGTAYITLGPADDPGGDAASRVPFGPWRLFVTFVTERGTSRFMYPAGRWGTTRDECVDAAAAWVERFGRSAEVPNPLHPSAWRDEYAEQNPTSAPCGRPRNPLDPLGLAPMSGR